MTSVRNIEIKIVEDQYPDNPRDDSNLGTMACYHKRYTLGDTPNIKIPDSVNSWNEAEEFIVKEHKACVILPLYLYDHSGLSIQVTPFNCKWDSGQVGFIFTTKERIREERGVRYVTKKQIAKATETLIYEVRDYNAYLSGECYGWSLIEDGEIIDECYGYNDRADAEAAANEAKKMVI